MATIEESQAVPSPVTVHQVSTESKAHKRRWYRFLGRVMQDNDQQPFRYRWNAVSYVHTSPDEDDSLRLEFRRLVRGETGQADCEVRVKTNIPISVYGVSGDRGENSAGAPLLCVKGIWVESYTTPMLAWLLLQHDELSLGVTADHGSQHCQAAGLHFYALRVYRPNVGSFQVGEATIMQGNQILCAGAVQVRRYGQEVA